MDFFKNLKLRVKLFGSFMLAILLTLIISSLAVGALNTSTSVADNVAEMIEVRYQKLLTVSEASSGVTGEMVNYLTPGNQTQDRKNHIETSITNLQNELATIDPSLSPDEFNSIIENTKKYIDGYTSVIAPLVAQGNAYDALNYYLANMHTIGQEVERQYLNVNHKLVEMIDKEVQNNRDTTTMILVLVFSVIAILFSMGVAALVSRYIVGQIEDSCDIAREVAKNNLDVDILNYSKDEFGQLFDAMRTMRDDLSDSIRLVIQTSKDLKNELDNVHDISSKIVEASRNAENQAITVAAASDEMVSTTGDIAKNCESAAAVSEQTKRNTNSGMDLVRASVNEIKEQSVRTQEDGHKIETLAEQTHKIGSIVSTIDDIAAQTNLLALNAAIEAARAGDAGRGFAVVADEVRALASRTTKSTHEISQMVSQIQSDASVATQSMSESVENMNQVAVKAGDIQTTLDGILSQVNNVNGQITQIATAAEEQTTATAEISSNMQLITSASQDIAQVADSAIEKVDRSVVSINELLKNLDRFQLRRTG